MVYEILMAAVTGLDQAAKMWVERQEPEDFPREMKGSGGRVKLYRNHNSGFPFGFLKEHEAVVRTLPMIVTSMLGGVFCYLLGKKGHRAHKAALAVLIGGSVSNLVDRYARGYVVDYFSVEAGPLKKVVWNLGDICVFLGSAVLLVAELWEDAADRRVHRAKSVPMPAAGENND